MRSLTIELTDEAYTAICEAIARQTDAVTAYTVTFWLENELNNNTDAIIEMLLSDF